MSSFVKIIKQDINAACKALEEDEFDLMNIFANRITSNAYFIDNKRLTLPGVLIKEVAFDFISLRKIKGDISSIKSIGKDFCDRLKKLIHEENVEIIGMWKSFYEYKTKVRKLQVTKIEQNIYTDNIEFCDAVITKLVTSVNDEQLKKAVNGETRLIKGFINEIGRVISVHGTKPSQLSFLILLKMLDRNIDYLTYMPKKADSDVEEIMKLAKQVFQFWSSSKSKKEDDIYTEATDILGNLTILWRKKFISYLDPYRHIC